MFHAAIIDPKKTKKIISLLRAEKFPMMHSID